MKDNFILPDYVNITLDMLNSSNYEAYIVGGCVRDFLLDRVPNDFDVTTNALPLQTEAVFKGYHVIETGLKHGTVTVVILGTTVEITTYRIDGVYSDGRHPDTVEYTSKLKDDLSRRDFTINAMAYNKSTGIVDEFNGVHDLNHKTIKCVGSPAKRFSEDALRIMRAIRFSSQLDFDIDIETANMVHALKDTLLKVSVERIAVELNKLIMGERVHSILVEYHDIFETIIPEVTACVGFNQHSKYHKYDVWEHIAIATQNAPKVLTIRLAMLLHDIAKPKVFTLDSKGNGHFYRHAHEGSAMAETILKRLKYDNFTIKRVCTLIYHHDDDFKSDYDIKTTICSIGKEAFFELLQVQQADAMAKQDFCRGRIEHIQNIKSSAISMLDSHECLSLKDLQVTGSDIKSLGFNGKSIGLVLDTLLKEVFKGSIENNRQSLLDRAINLKDI